MIDVRFTICGIEELERAIDGSVSHVVSIADPGWPELQPLSRLPPDRVHSFRFHDIIAATGGLNDVPCQAHIGGLITAGRTIRAGDPTHLLVHCHMGVSRSSAATLILLSAEHPGRELEAAERILRHRPQAWPNSLMLELADDALDAEGRIVEAGREIRRRTARARPEFVDYLLTTHRRVEVEDL